MKWGNWDAILLAFLAAILQTTVIYNYLTLFFKRKSYISSSIILITVFIINIICSFITTIFSLPPIVNVILSAVCFSFFLMIFKGHLSSKVVFIALILSIISALELVSRVFLSYKKKLYNSQIFDIYTEVIAIIILATFFYVLRSTIKRRVGSKQNNKIHSLILFPISNIIIM